MKVQTNSNVILLDQKRMERAQKAQAKAAMEIARGKEPIDSVNIQMSNRLDKTLQTLSENPLTAAEVHDLFIERIEYLLADRVDVETQAVKPNLEEMLSVVAKLEEAFLRYPSEALEAHNLDPNRVALLLEPVQRE